MSTTKDDTMADSPVPGGLWNATPAACGAEGRYRQGCGFHRRGGDHLASPPPVLLVEDNRDDEALTLRAFKTSGFVNEVIVVRDGAEALAYLLDDGDAWRRPALILLGLELPEVGGLEVLHRIRVYARTQYTPVVVFATSAQEEDVSASYRGGANAYVRKPVNYSAFAEAVNAIGVFWLDLTEPLPDGISPTPAAGQSANP